MFFISSSSKFIEARKKVGPSGGEILSAVANSMRNWGIYHLMRLFVWAGFNYIMSTIPRIR
jgi:hypothetical protein